MTREVYKANKLALEWWAKSDKNNLLCRQKSSSSNSDWGIEYTSQLSSNCIYIQNDEYVELRKALADGKVIQYCMAAGLDWVDQNDTDPQWQFINNLNFYRVKPKERNLAIGDWVQGFGEVKRLTTQEEVDQANDSRLQWTEKWEPKNGDICMFFDDKNDLSTYRIGYYERYRTDGPALAGSHYNTSTWRWYLGVAPLVFDINQYVDKDKELI